MLLISVYGVSNDGASSHQHHEQYRDSDNEQENFKYVAHSRSLKIYAL